MPANPTIHDFFNMPPAERHAALWRGIQTAHTYHFERNAAYQRAVAARGVGAAVSPAELALLLRPAALTFKGYAETLGPFPQDDPAGFVAWLSEQLSIPLPRQRWSHLRRRYPTMEALLSAVEGLYADLGLEIVTSSGTSGRASMVARDAATVELAVDSFFTAIRRVWGIQRGTALVFVMPADTRVAMARTARFGTRQLDWASESPIYYTMPFAATPDQIRIRAGRTLRPGLRGLMERRILCPFTGWANEHLATPRFLKVTRARLEECAHADRPLMLLGGWVQLHALAHGAPLALPAGSRIAAGGGMKERYPFTPAQIRADLRAAFGATPISDVYGMAEANWAAFECEHGNYHIPPWVYAVVVDDDDHIAAGPEATGLLAFFDPFGGGPLLPPFFQTADRVRLVNAGDAYDPALACPCGYASGYIRGGIRRVDLLEEAGCAAQV